MENSPEAKKPQKKNLPEALAEAIKELKQTFQAFARAPKALWGVNGPYVLEGLVYFGILTILGKFCSENVALSDPQAGWVYGVVTGGITFFMVVLGGVSDKIGVRQSLAIALFTMMIGRILISLSGTIQLDEGMGSPMFFLMSAGLLMMVVAYGLYQPAAYAGVKRYTNPNTAAMGYAVVYALMNLGAFFSGFISPVTRHFFEDYFPPNGLTAVFWIYSLITLVAFLITIIILTKKTDEQAVRRISRETVEMKRDKGDAENSVEKEKSGRNSNRYLILWTAIALFFLCVFLWQLFSEQRDFYLISLVGTTTFGVLTVWEFLRKRPDHPFRDLRFVFFIFILIPVQTLFAHNWLTLPYYLDRAFTGSVVGEYFEFFSNLNPILIFILAPVIAALTARANVYRMMIVGTLVMAAPTFLLSVGPHTMLFLIYVLIMTVGEAMWQPRFLQWIAEIAPEGRTGAYMGIGQFPWFLTKLLTATYSGYFVANYIPHPETALPMRTGEMWFIYGLIAMISPVALILAKNWMKAGMKKNKG